MTLTLTPALWPQSSHQPVQRFLGLGWAALGYVVYLPLVTTTIFLGYALWRASGRLIARCHRHGWSVVTALLLLSTLQSPYPRESWLQLAHFLPYFLLWAALCDYLHAHHRPLACLEQWDWLLVLGSIPLNGLALWQRFLGQARPASLFSNPNLYGNYTVIVLGMALGLLAAQLDNYQSSEQGTKHQRNSILLGLASLLLVLGSLVSGSRNSALITVVILVVGGCCLPWRGWGRWLVRLGFGGLGAVGLGWVMAQRQLSSIWAGDEARVYVWQLALELIAQSPWWGNGLGSYKFLYDGRVPNHDSMPHAHNLWLSLAAEAGLPAAIALTVVVGILCYGGVRSLLNPHKSELRRTVGLSYGLGFLATTLFHLFDLTLFDARLNLLGWLCLAALTVVSTVFSSESRASSSETKWGASQFGDE